MAEDPDNSTEAERLLEQVRAGEAGAVDRLLAQYRTYLRQVVEMRLDPQLRRRVDASDVVQETQMEAARRLKEYLAKESMPFRLWLRQIAFDQLSNARRYHVTVARRSATREVSLPERSSLQLARQLLVGRSTPSQQVAKQEQTRRMQNALAQMPEVDRELILMRNLEELTYEEIGYVLEISSDAARKRHGRALRRLSKIFHEHD